MAFVVHDQQTGAFIVAEQGTSLLGSPAAPSVSATATSWDRVHVVVQASENTDETDVLRDSVVIDTLLPDGEFINTGLAASTEYIYDVLAKNAFGETPSPVPNDATTFGTDAAYTDVGDDAIEIPFTVGAAESVNELRLQAGKVVNALSGLAKGVDFRIIVRDAAENVLADQVLVDVPMIDGGLEYFVGLSRTANNEVITAFVSAEHDGFESDVAAVLWEIEGAEGGVRRFLTDAILARGSYEDQDATATDAAVLAAVRDDSAATFARSPTSPATQVLVGEFGYDGAGAPEPGAANKIHYTIGKDAADDEQIDQTFELLYPTGDDTLIFTATHTNVGAGPIPVTAVLDEPLAPIPAGKLRWRLTSNAVP